jgi:hypothetical protein
VQSVVEAPFGFQPRLDVEQFATLADWKRSHG